MSILDFKKIKGEYKVIFLDKVHNNVIISINNKTKGSPITLGIDLGNLYINTFFVNLNGFKIIGKEPEELTKLKKQSLIKEIIE